MTPPDLRLRVTPPGLIALPWDRVATEVRLRDIPGRAQQAPRPVRRDRRAALGAEGAAPPADAASAGNAILITRSWTGRGSTAGCSCGCRSTARDTAPGCATPWPACWSACTATGCSGATARTREHHVLPATGNSSRRTWSTPRPARSTPSSAPAGASTTSTSSGGHDRLPLEALTALALRVVPLDAAASMAVADAGTDELLRLTPAVLAHLDRIHDEEQRGRT